MVFKIKYFLVNMMGIKLFLSRKEKILSSIDVHGKGLEIGPSHNPVAPKRSGYNVDIIDYLDKDELINKYAGHNVELNNIEEVDFIWSGESYSELIGKDSCYDWVIASHVIEHTPDLVGFINNCSDMLNEKGVISLVIPDFRYCFDYFRSPSSLSQVLDAYYEKRTRHSLGSVVECSRNQVNKGGEAAWGKFSKGKYTHTKSLENTVNLINLASKTDEYIDVHAWCLTPNLFRLMLFDLHSLGYIEFKEVSFFETKGCEFYIALGRGEVESESNRDKLALDAKNDLYYIPSLMEKLLHLYLLRPLDRLNNWLNTLILSVRN